MIFVKNISVILARMTEFWNALHSGNLEYTFVLMGLHRNSRMTRILDGILKIWTNIQLFQALTPIPRFTENPLSPYGRESHLLVGSLILGRKGFAFTLTGGCP
ncbi:MAG: hypothetical protein IPI58_05995 [Alphaproteobacteria bacterium]|nr:MAG: hypothetical protein IPI58_05995 [Alphaproteobacteria bacterium]